MTTGSVVVFVECFGPFEGSVARSGVRFVPSAGTGTGI